MKKVSFTEMKNGTKEDYLFLEKHEKNYASKTADRIIKYMSGLTETLEGYQISRLEHSLQSATKALKAIFWEGTENWDKLLTDRAEISGKLILSAFSKNAISAIKNK